MDDSTPAGDLYEHRLEAQQHGRLRRAILVAGDVIAAALAGPIDLASAGDVVVRRRVDQIEVLRIPAGPPEEAAQVMARVGEQLAALSLAEFHEAWSVEGLSPPAS